MRILSLIAVVVFLSASAIPARAGMAEDCVQDSDWDLKIGGCTAAILSGQWQGKELAWAYTHRCWANNEVGNHHRAIEDCNQALWLDPGDAWAYNNRGIAYRNLGEYRRAIADSDQALRLDAGIAEAYISRGNAYYVLGELRRAIADYDQALRLDPDNSAAYYNRGLAYNGRAWELYLMGQNIEALGDVDRSLSDRPGDAYGIDTRAHVLAALGRRGEALAEFERVMQIGRADSVREYQEALAKHGYYRGAIDGVYGPQVRAALVACLEAGCRLLE